MIIRPLTAEDQRFFPEALHLLNRTQGQDLFAPDYLHIRTADPKSLVLVAMSNDQIVAVGVAQVISSYEFYLPFDSNIVSELEGKTVGSFSTLCVSETLQGQGIGQKLSQLRLEWLKGQNCQTILGVSWKSGLAHTSDRVFQKLGFRAVKLLPEFFYQSSLERPFVCPGCGEPPCTCPAELYRLDLISKGVESFYTP